MGRTTTYGSRVSFAMDQGSLVRNGGRQVDWNYINDVYRSTAATVTMAAAAAAGATSLTVEALPVAVQAGTILNFGTYAPVTVTVNDADVNATETTITVAALSGPIPAGTILQFSGAGAGFAKLTAAAAAAATTLTVEALPEDIDNAATALFPGGTLQARVTANAAAAATALTVDELQFAIADDLTATLGGTGDRTVLAGTVMCELSSKKVVPRSIRPGSETAIGLIETDAVENDRAASLTGYGIIIGGAVFENLLPDATGGPPEVLNSTYKTELQTAGVGTGFAFYQYADDSAA
jgi:hypothetical protein